MSKKQKQAKRASLERGAVWREPSLLSDQDIYLFNEGRHNYLHNHLGAHLLEHDGIEGAYFAVWAFMGKLASGLMVGLAGVALSMTGYVENAEQTPLVRTTIIALNGGIRGDGLNVACKLAAMG